MVLRCRLASEGTIAVKEATPSFGGARRRDLDILVIEGTARWAGEDRIERADGIVGDEVDLLPERTRPADDLRAGLYGRR
jgi:hypothetical protein